MLKSLYSISMKRIFIVCCILTLPLQSFAQKKAVQKGITKLTEKEAASAAARAGTGLLEKELLQQFTQAETNFYADELQEMARQYTLQHPNRNLRTAPLRKHRLTEKEQASWRYRKEKQINYGFVDKNKLVQDIVDKKIPLPAGLNTLRQLQARIGRQDLYALFMMKSYLKHFKIISQHQKYFFERVGQLNSPKLEEEVVKRVAFLMRHEPQFQLAQPVIFSNITSIYYTRDIARLTPENFSADDLVLAAETVYGDQFTLGAFTALPSYTRVSINGRAEPVFLFRQLDHLSELYRFLVTGEQPQPMEILFDYDKHSLFLYNQAHTRWLRVTPHEFGDPTDLHVHLNQLHTWELTLPGGITKQEKMLEILEIPLAPAPAQNMQGLYRLFITQPLKVLRQDPSVISLRSAK